MLIVLALVILGDFHYTAPSGHWLDDARCGPLSANRFLVVEQVGTKGQYHLGATQKVLDASGDFLYDIPVAENAWMVRNGVLGNEDIYLYQNRGEHHLMLWRPGKNPVTLECQSGDTLIRPGTTATTRTIKLAREGTRLVVVSEVETSLGEDQGTKHVLLEMTCLQDIDWAAGKVSVERFLSAEINAAMAHRYDGDTMILFSDFTRTRTYFRMDLGEKTENTLPLHEEQAALQIQGLEAAAGYISYFSRLRPAGASGLETISVIQKIGDPHPVLAWSENDRDINGFHEVEQLFRAFNEGAIQVIDGMLTFAVDGVVTTFQPESGLLSRYPAPWTGQGFSRANDTLSVTCDDQTFRVTRRSAASAWHTEPISRVDCAPFKRTFQP